MIKDLLGAALRAHLQQTICPADSLSIESIRNLKCDVEDDGARFDTNQPKPVPF
jgi:hypothetical protein